MKITDHCNQQSDSPIFICDYSPLKSGGPETWSPAAKIDADYIAVAYNPGKVVRTNSAFLAYAIRHHTGRDVIFNLGTRDMNKLAIQSLLLGAQALSLENVMILQGDPFTEKQLEQVVEVSDYTPTELIRSIAEMNAGRDYKGLGLQKPTDFCIGGTVDLGRGVSDETRLAVKKVESGAEFLVTQPVFNPEIIQEFIDLYESISGSQPSIPIFWGLQVFVEGGVIFSSVPEHLREELNRGRSGIEIAVEVYHTIKEAAAGRFYLNSSNPKRRPKRLRRCTKLPRSGKMIFLSIVLLVQ